MPAIRLISCVLLLSALPAYPGDAPARDAQVTDAQKVLGWKNERVFFLPPVTEDATIFTWCEPERRLDQKKYAGRTGVITDVAIVRARDDHPGQLSHNGAYQLKIALDEPAETITLCSAEDILFVSDLEAARRLVGQPFWIKDKEEVLDCSTRTVKAKVGNAERLVFTGFDFGDARREYVVHVKTDAGVEGCLDLDYWNGNYRMGFDDRFHLEGSTDLIGAPFLKYFYATDPRKDNPTWTAAIWQLIAEGRVAIGMTEDMARYACSGSVEEIGAAVGDDGDIARMYECSGQQRFLVAKGRVTKYVE